MHYNVLMPRPLTDAERARIQDARRRLDEHDRERAALAHALALAILEPYNRRAHVGDLAEAAGYSRKTIHEILKRLGENT